MVSIEQYRFEEKYSKSNDDETRTIPFCLKKAQNKFKNANNC